MNSSDDRTVTVGPEMLLNRCSMSGPGSLSSLRRRPLTRPLPDQFLFFGRLGRDESVDCGTGGGDVESSATRITGFVALRAAHADVFLFCSQGRTALSLLGGFVRGSD